MDHDEDRPVDCLSQDGASALNEGFAAPLAGLLCHQSAVCEAGDVFGVHVSSLGHVDHWHDGAALAQAGDACEFVEAGLDLGRGGDLFGACGGMRRRSR